ncbi:malate dehydrogenase [Fasciola hepatica]|uniref:Malate dehydrogenase n=1 Tax=Fasciola hepatica TaxID=6192 RepID=A0A4E0RPD9_FASHE|nr:malate dehydrogenase [Fasciola hepatica]
MFSLRRVNIFRTAFIRSANMSCVTPDEYTHVVRKEDVVDFCARCVEKVGISSEHSRVLGEVLVAGDYRGHYSHGINRLAMYVRDVELKVCDSNATPVIEKQTASTALVNGKNLLGPVVGNFAMNLAIKKAKETGIAWVAVRAGWYSIMAAKQGMIGISCTNTSPLVYPTRSKARTVGTNPITIAAPSSKPGDEFVLDMATSAVALGKLEMCRRRGLPIPEGWGADKNGRVSVMKISLVYQMIMGYVCNQFFSKMIRLLEEPSQLCGVA